MVGHGTKYSRKKEAAIAGLLEQRSVPEAARAADISTPTLYRWLKMPAFMEEYRRARLIVMEQAYARTQQNAGIAVSVLLKLMVDSSTPASGRIRAALGLLGLARQGLDRVWQLERCKGIMVTSLRDASDEELVALLASAEQRPEDDPIQ